MIGAPRLAYIRVVWHQVGTKMSSERISLYDVIARLTNLALQYGARLEKVSDLLASAQFAPCSPVSGHDHLKQCSSLLDLIGRHLFLGNGHQKEAT